jgi:hypothetical protein
MNLQVQSFTAETAEIRQLHESVIGHARDALKEAIDIGGLLVKVKENLKHGRNLTKLASRKKTEKPLPLVAANWNA